MKKILILIIVFITLFSLSGKSYASMSPGAYCRSLGMNTDPEGGCIQPNTIIPVSVNASPSSNVVSIPSISTPLTDTENEKLNNLIIEVNNLKTKVTDLESQITIMQTNESNIVNSLETKIKELESKKTVTQIKDIQKVIDINSTSSSKNFISSTSSTTSLVKPQKSSFLHLFLNWFK